MLDIAAGSAKKTNAQRKPRKCAEPHSALRCGQIGISAVAVAARYQSGLVISATRRSWSNWTSGALGRLKSRKCLLARIGD
jgi:hypothetical protein